MTDVSPFMQLMEKKKCIKTIANPILHLALNKKLTIK